MPVSLMISLLFQALAMIIFASAPALDLSSKESSAEGKIQFWLACSIYGIAFGSVGALLPLITMESFGTLHFGQIYGQISLSFVISSLLAPLLAGQSYDLTQSYKPSLGVIACLFFFLIILRPPRSSLFP